MNTVSKVRTQTSIAIAIAVLVAPFMVGIPSVQAQAATCVPNKNVRMRIEFTKVSNVNAGDARAQVELGNGLTVAAGSNIDLVRNGGNVIDLGDPTRSGLNVKRTPGTLTFRNHGNAADFVTRETMQGRIILEGGHFTGFTNGSPTRDPLEQQGNGTYDEDAGNDEVAFAPNVTVIPFFTTVSTGSDNWSLTYAPDTVCTTTSPVVRTGRGTRGTTITNTNMNLNANTNTQVINMNINNSSNNSANNSSKNSSENNNKVYVWQGSK